MKERQPYYLTQTNQIDPLDEVSEAFLADRQILTTLSDALLPYLSFFSCQGINVTRRTVAKYREDMKIPSTHQRRVRN